LDFTPLTDRLNRIHTVLEKQAERQESHSEGIGDTKFIMNALTSHLSKIQGVTEQNAQHVKALHDKQSSTADRMHNAVVETSEQIQSLVQRNKEQEARIDSQNSQLRELMSGQREMVEVMRQLEKNVVAQNKGSCDHIVVPPPRKMGRKVVGFVYDAKEGHIDDRPRGPERSVTSSRSRTPERPSGLERRFTTNV
jgi:TolA-binding protein